MFLAFMRIRSRMGRVVIQQICSSVQEQPIDGLQLEGLWRGGYCGVREGWQLWVVRRGGNCGPGGYYWVATEGVKVGGQLYGRKMGGNCVGQGGVTTVSKRVGRDDNCGPEGMEGWGMIATMCKELRQRKHAIPLQTLSNLYQINWHCHVNDHI